jgi:hypothetical protein
MSTIYALFNKDSHNNKFLVNMDPYDDYSQSENENDEEDEEDEEDEKDEKEENEEDKDNNNENYDKDYTESDDEIFSADEELETNTKRNTTKVQWDPSVNFTFDAANHSPKQLDVFFGNKSNDALKIEISTLKLQLHDINKEKNMYKYALIGLGCFAFFSYIRKSL